MHSTQVRISSAMGLAETMMTGMLGRRRLISRATTPPSMPGIM
jgi:hypothetical protein